MLFLPARPLSISKARNREVRTAVEALVGRIESSRISERALPIGHNSNGRRAAMTVTAVAATALVATAAYVWWRRHDGAHTEPHPWRSDWMPAASQPSSDV